MFGKVQRGPLIGKYKQRQYICPHCKYQVNLTNPDTHEILDILPKRDTHALIRYFASFKHKDRLQVKLIVMDISIQFKRIMEALFPHAHIIYDRYHVCRLVDWVVERVRKRKQHKLAAYSRMLKQNKRVLMKHLTHWLELVKVSGLDEFNNFFTSFPAWMTQLTNAFLLPYSNGYTEGTNNKIKVLKRISYGLRHFGRFRVRILLLSKKNGTNHTDDWYQKRLVG